ncbi:copper-translocating P-type ATPase [Loigolactobacillus backii]|uniref:heavy metal translocating P-type ATPase n=1 Tax=Loigolactobacillus backii TaxID=375175 RepID=UPI0007F09B34|nr:heavy metal translocating P-type ATPase [Loigolactobacillus backii]ANK60396.1 HAD family hydrolase [Loigolactobacillus backii]ANK67835.1 HAD family hydrolase [Loigolactobacillus backii]OLF70292.1 HAD family hydrolase [Loigolactobacillus backii]PIO82587.1 copper-translocating P-type ATPase [Loigolactobacillus backii]PIO86939.1 copper-translocating P-type ATPase [Loigolactobacillus backii]
MKFERFIQKNTNNITIATAILIAIGFIANWLGLHTLYTVAFIIASIIAAVPIIIRAYESLRVKTISIELLVSIAVVGAFIIQEYNESAIVTFLFLFGGFLEEKTLARTRQSIKSLTEMAPTTALVVQDDGTTVETDVDDVDEGDVVLVKTGAQVPVDGDIVDGAGYLNEASVTGESKLVTKREKDAVFSGTILDNGTLQIRATKVGDDTTFAKIIELVEDAQDTKSHAEKFIDRFATYYTPAVILIALIVGLISRDFRLAITVLVLGCPGALVIGAPVSNVAGIGNGAKNGVLIKGGEVVDTFAKVDTLVFDKTGTLTKGTTEVSAVKNYAADAKQVSALVAKIESLSDHPLGKAITDYATNKQIDFDKLAVTNSTTVKGQGVSATVSDHQLLVGNQKMMTANQVELTTSQLADLHQLQSEGSSTVIVAVDQVIQQIIGVSDVVRDNVRPALAQLKQMGIKHLVMLTGDNQITANYVAEQLGIDEVHANLLPEDKVKFVKQFKAAGRTVAFIGDGINDSPSIATADIGIAMGGGTDVAVETSDIVLMRSSFAELVHAYGLAKKTVLNTRENIVIAIGTVVFLLIGLIFGYIYMASGMFVHEASILVVIFNAMRLIQYRPRSSKQQTATKQSEVSHA